MSISRCFWQKRNARWIWQYLVASKILLCCIFLLGASIVETCCCFYRCCYRWKSFISHLRMVVGISVERKAWRNWKGKIRPIQKIPTYSDILIIARFTDIHGPEHTFIWFGFVYDTYPLCSHVRVCDHSYMHSDTKPKCRYTQTQTHIHIHTYARCYAVE